MTFVSSAPHGTCTQTQIANQRARRSSTSKSRARQRARDQYYTTPDEAARLLGIAKTFLQDKQYGFIEPSAGCGFFLHIMPEGSIGYDLYPRCKCIIKGDFLKVTLPTDQPLVVIGNPPFGRSARLAVDFFNHAAFHPNVLKICFIFPPSIRKARIENRLHQNFHRVHEEAVSDCAFLFDGQPHHVPAVFQIWERRDAERVPHSTKIRHADFELTTPEKADFLIRRNGASAGRIHHDRDVKPKENYSIKSKVKGLRDVESIMRELDFKTVVNNVAGARSLALVELVSLYQAWLDANG